MSRCYPYPPPGYAKKLCSSHEALIFQIKLQNEKERVVSDNVAEMLKPEKSKSSEKRKDKEHKKKEKKDKGERRKEKKEKKREKKAKASALVDNGKDVDVGKLPNAGNTAFENNGKLQGSSAEFLERSCVTEEYGQPIESQNTSYSSDSTGNSGKRKRVAASPSGIQCNGNLIRIRVSSSQNRDEPSTSGSIEQVVDPVPHNALQRHIWPGVNPVNSESSFPLNDVITSGLAHPHIASTSMTTLRLAPMMEDASHLKEKTTESKFLKEKLSSRDKKMQKRESLFKKFVVNWVAPQLERAQVVNENEDDEEWLFGNKDEDRSAKRLRLHEECQNLRDNLSCSASAVMQPCAQSLADIGLYALPYVAPY